MEPDAAASAKITVQIAPNAGSGGCQAGFAKPRYHGPSSVIVPPIIATRQRHGGRDQHGAYPPPRAPGSRGREAEQVPHVLKEDPRMRTWIGPYEFLVHIGLPS